MAELASVSDEVLNQILESSSLHVITLWRCGNHNFNHRIERSCSYVRSCPILSSTTLKKWPRMLSRLSALQVLHIHVIAIDEPIAAISTQIRRLSPSLQKLSLSFERANAVLLEDGSPTLFLDDNHSYRHNLVASSLWNVSTSFPNLKEATFWNSGSLLGSHFVCADTESFAIFPASLQKLAWNPLFHTSTLFHRLPQGLLSLEVKDDWTEPTYTQGAAVGNSMPKNLTHLAGFSPSGDIAIASLPRTLKTGDWLSRSQATSILTPGLLAALPPATMILNEFFEIQLEDFNRLGISWPTALPPSLTSFQSPICLDATTLSLLPRTLRSITLTTIEIGSLSRLEEECGLEKVHNVWPPLLEHLEIHSTPPFTPIEHSKLLPRTLKGLMFLEPEAYPPNLFEDMGDLPPLLTSLEASNCTWGCMKLPNMPQSLLSLKLYGAYDPWTMHLIPRSVTSLKLRNTSISTEDANATLQLPPKLEALRLLSIHVNLLPRLPPTLTLLEACFIEGGDFEEARELLPHLYISQEEPEF